MSPSYTVPELPKCAFEHAAIPAVKSICQKVLRLPAHAIVLDPARLRPCCLGAWFFYSSACVEVSASSLLNRYSVSWSAIENGFSFFQILVQPLPALARRRLTSGCLQQERSTLAIDRHCLGCPKSLSSLSGEADCIRPQAVAPLSLGGNFWDSPSSAGQRKQYPAVLFNSSCRTRSLCSSRSGQES